MKANWLTSTFVCETRSHWLLKELLKLRKLLIHGNRCKGRFTPQDWI